MLSDERRQEMADWICREGKADIAELAAYFGVSGETVRRDLAQIADGTRIRKVHGGAIAVRQPVRDESYAERRTHNLLPKQKIGAYAVRFLEDNDVIAIDSGTNAESFAQAIYRIRNLKVITGSIPVALILARKIAAGDFTGSVILLSGTVNPETQTVTGVLTLSQMQSLRVDKAFLAATAVDASGLMTWQEQDGLLTGAFLQQADRAYLLAESEKFGRQSFCHVAGFRELNDVVTDSRNPIPEEIRSAICAAGAALHVVPVPAAGAGEGGGACREP